MEQVTEGVAKLALVAVAVLLAPLPPSFQAGIVALVVGVPVLTTLLLLVATRARDLEARAAERDGRQAAVLHFMVRVANGLNAIRRWRAFGSATALAVVQKVAEGLAIAAVARALGVPLSVSGVVLVLAAVNLSTMISVTPANVGIYEGTAFVALRVVGVDIASALGLAVLLHVAYLVPLAGAGWVLLAVEGLGLEETTRGSRDPAKEKRE